MKRAATAHLNAKEIHTALSHFTDDVIAISNTEIFSSHEELAAEVGEYYKILKSVNHAFWEGVHIQVIHENAAIFTAKLHYGFTSVEDETTNLKGVWTALFILDNGEWRIRLRHESFEKI